VLFYDQFISSINFVCNSYADYISEPNNKRKVADLLFKFIIYFYSFLDELATADNLIVKFLSSVSSSDIYDQIENVKQRLFYLLTLPINIKFNNQTPVQQECAIGNGGNLKLSSHV